MDNQTLSVILWIAAGIISVLFLMRRRKRRITR